MPGFDTVVTHFDEKTHKITKHSPYRAHFKGRSVQFERPPGSGILFHPDGSYVDPKRAKQAEAAAAEAAKPKPVHVTPKGAELYSLAEIKAYALGLEDALERKQAEAALELPQEPPPTEDPPEPDPEPEAAPGPKPKPDKAMDSTPDELPDINLELPDVPLGQA